MTICPWLTKIEQKQPLVITKETIMKIKIITFLAVFFLSVYFCCVSFAETIYLKDGRVVKEKIVERGAYYIITEDNKIPHKYFEGQIERIEEDGMDTSGIDVAQFEKLGMPVEKARAILTLINVSGVRRNMEQSIQQVIARVPEENKAQYEQLFNIDEIIERLIPLYDKYYSEADLKGAIAFYESPIGKKILEVTPEIMKESVGILVNYVKEKSAP